MFKEKDLKKLHGYTLVKEEALPDLDAVGYLLRHTKSGAKVALLPTSDSNKVFTIAFRTPPKDATGVAHILEHSVLCGSKHFPLKDPFVELAKGSMNTFLNAMTYPDKTMYPIASTNDKDFKNLMHVYLDAVFYPNVYQEEKIFLQEGWRYQLDKASDPLRYNGVVYNEMKGSYSSPESILEENVFTSLFPDTPYGVDSGGDPSVIPTLRYEDFLAFHKRYYHPSNAYIYLYGDLDMVDALCFIDQTYLRHFKRQEIDSEIAMQPRFSKMRKMNSVYPLAQGENPAGKCYFSYNVLAGDPFDMKEMAALSVLDYALFSSPGAPVKQAILDAGIAKDVSASLMDGVREPFFSIIAKEAKAKDEKLFYDTIQKTLKKIARQGIRKKSLLAALNSMAFQYREADYGGFPKGLIYGIDMFDTWLYRDDAAFLSLQRGAVYRSLRREIKNGYFEKLLCDIFLHPKHASFVTMRPKPGLLVQQEKEVREKLDRLKAAMSKQEINALVRACRSLDKWQKAAEDPRALAKIPTLKRSDIRRKVRQFSNIVKVEDDTKIVFHRANTSGIVYLEAMWNVTDIKEESLADLSLLSRFLTNVSTKKHSYIELNDELGIHTGGVSFSLRSYQKQKQRKKYQAYLVLSMRVMEEELKAAMRLLTEICTSSDFSDHKRQKELMQSYSLSLAAAIQQSGHSFAALRASAYLSGMAAHQDCVTGIAFYQALQKIVNADAKAYKAWRMRLQALFAKVMSKDRLLFHATCAKSAEALVLSECKKFRQRMTAPSMTDDIQVKALGALNEAIVTAGQVQYVAVCGMGDEKLRKEAGTLRVFEHYLNYDYLWQRIRVQGGAYGCGASFRRGDELVLYSYRDPKLGDTLDILLQIAQAASGFTAGTKEMTKFVIGAISALDTPLTPSAFGLASMLAYMSGQRTMDRQKTRDRLLSAGVPHIRKLAAPISEALKDKAYCAVCSETAYQKDKERFAREVRLQ